MLCDHRTWIDCRRAALEPVLSFCSTFSRCIGFHTCLFYLFAAHRIPYMAADGASLVDCDSEFSGEQRLSNHRSAPGHCLWRDRPTYWPNRDPMAPAPPHSASPRDHRGRYRDGNALCHCTRRPYEKPAPGDAAPIPSPRSCSAHWFPESSLQWYRVRRDSFALSVDQCALQAYRRPRWGASAVWSVAPQASESRNRLPPKRALRCGICLHVGGVQDHARRRASISGSRSAWAGPPSA